MRNICVGVKLWLLPCYTCFPWVNIQQAQQTKKYTQGLKSTQKAWNDCAILCAQMPYSDLKNPRGWVQANELRTNIILAENCSTKNFRSRKDKISKTAFIHPWVLIKSQGQHISILMCFNMNLVEKHLNENVRWPAANFNKIPQDVRNALI